MIKARFSPKAERDLDEACRHIAADNPEAAERVRQAILFTADFSRSIRKLEDQSARLMRALLRFVGLLC